MPWLSPIALVLAGVVLLLLALAIRHRLLAAAGLLLALLGLAAMTPIVANALLKPLEDAARPQAGECEGVQAIVLLAGGLQRPATGVDDYAALSRASLKRGLSYLEHGHDPALPLVIAGGSVHEVAESQVLGTLLDALGLRAAPLMLETLSLSTAQNAVEVRRLLDPGVRRVGLVTSALHMPRAQRAFQRAGFDVCRVPLDSLYIDAGGIGAFWPQSSALVKTEAVLHERVGELYYRWREGDGPLPGVRTSVPVEAEDPPEAE